MQVQTGSGGVGGVGGSGSGGVQREIDVKEAKRLAYRFCPLWRGGGLAMEPSGVENGGSWQCRECIV